MENTIGYRCSKLTNGALERTLRVGRRRSFLDHDLICLCMWPFVTMSVRKVINVATSTTIYSFVRHLSFVVLSLSVKKKFERGRKVYKDESITLM